MLCNSKALNPSSWVNKLEPSWQYNKKKFKKGKRENPGLSRKSPVKRDRRRFTSLCWMSFTKASLIFGPAPPRSRSRSRPCPARSGLVSFVGEQQDEAVPALLEVCVSLARPGLHSDALGFPSHVKLHGRAANLHREVGHSYAGKHGDGCTVISLYSWLKHEPKHSP